MKKKYIKPIVIFENFSLSTNIAGNCRWIVDNSVPQSCTYTGTGGIIIFMNEAQGCSTFEPDGNYDGYCYDVPMENNNLFNS